MTEGDRPDADFAGDDAAEVGGQRRIVVARTIQIQSACLHRGDGPAIDVGETLMRVAVVKAVAERDDHAWIVAGDHGGKARQASRRG